MLKAFATAKGLAKLQCTELCTKDEGQDVSATNQANLAALAFCPRIWGTDGSLAMVSITVGHLLWHVVGCQMQRRPQMQMSEATSYRIACM